MIAAARKLQPDREQALLDLLCAAIEELHLMACDIVRLGEELSSGRVAPIPECSRALQTFDLLAQRAFAQMRLLQGLERGLRGGDQAIEELIAQVPFQEIRTRLSGAALPAVSPRQDPEIDWF